MGLNLEQKQAVVSEIAAQLGSTQIGDRADVEAAILRDDHRLRASELRGLSWRQFEFKSATVTIDQRADAMGTIGAPKSQASRRSIPLPSSAILALKQWKLACPKTPADLVFPSIAGKVMSHRYMTLNLLHPLVGNDRVTLHDLRHAAASLWIEQRVEPKRVQTWLGHHSIQVTFDTYGHLFEAGERETSVAAAIEKELIG